jgi:diguanylate cyclase
MVARTRLAEAQLRHAQKQLSGLRSSLVDARRAADVDPLTELPNRRAFKRDLETLIERARASGEPLSLGFCDIDHFKKFNDAHGHETGDRVLRYVASTLAQAFESSGMVGRFGGEEFVVALPGMPLAAARDAIDATRQKLSSRHLFAATDHSALGTVGFSAGVTSLTADDGSAELLRRADEALYRAKSAGRDCVMIG